MRDGVLVLGAGVIGLTTAVVLAEAGRPVRVWAREEPPGTTSAVAGALWEPFLAEPRHRVLEWSCHTFRVLAGLAGTPGSGVRMVPGVNAAADGLPWWDPDLPGVAAAAGAAELPPGCRSGFTARLPLVDMPVYLRYLADRLTRAGGRVRQRAVTALDEAVAAAPVVVNCTGLGARSLVPDPLVRPVQGQLVAVENPGIDRWLVADEDGESLVYVFPQPDRVVLGGTARDGEWSTEADPRAAAEIVRRCTRAEPRLAGARVLRRYAGLRPYRPQVRLEREGPCVHNYGHGGSGVTVSWGCAAEAAALVANC